MALSIFKKGQFAIEDIFDIENITSLNFKLKSYTTMISIYKNKIEIGTANFLTAYGYKKTCLDRHAVEDVLSCAAELGFLKLDTAHSYGEIERLLIEKYSGKFEINTKISLRDASKDSVKVYNSAGFNKVYIHDSEAIFEESSAEMLDELFSIDAKIGLSAYTKPEIVRGRDLGIEFFQIPFNFFEGRFNKIIKKDLNFTARSVFLQGVLLKKDYIQAMGDSDIWKIYREHFQHLSPHDLYALLLFSVLENPNLDRVVVGISSIDQLVNLECALAKGPDDYRSALDQIPRNFCKNERFLNPRLWAS